MLSRDLLNRSILTWLSRARMLLACGLCATFASRIVWSSDKPGSWDIDRYSEQAAFLCFAPFALLLWALLPAWGDHGRSYRVTRLLLVLYAGLAAIVAFASDDLGWTIAAGLGGGIGLALVGLGPWRTSATGNLRFYKGSLLVLNGAVIAGLLILSFVNIGLVRWGADRIAGEKPYCVLILEEAGWYHEADRLIDLRGLSKYGPVEGDGVSYTIYAALVVQNEHSSDWYKWSYRHLGFVPIPRKELDKSSHDPREAACAMRPHFLRDLSIF